LAVELERIAADVGSGSLPAEQAAAAIFSALDSAPAEEREEGLSPVTEEALVRAVEAVLRVAGTLRALGDPDLEVFALSHPGTMFTPRREPVHRTAAAFVALYDVLSAGLAERGLEGILAGIQRGLTIEYGYPEEVREPGFARVRLDIDDARELAARAATVRLDWGGLSLLFPAEYLASAVVQGWDARDPGTYFYFGIEAPGLWSLPQLPPGTEFCGIEVGIRRQVSGYIEPPPYEGGGLLSIWLPLEWCQQPGAGQTYARAYCLDSEDVWRYCPGRVTDDGRLLVVLLPLDTHTLPHPGRSQVEFLQPARSLPGTAAPDVRIDVDGSPLALDVAPRLVSGRTMLPFRAVAEALGAEVTWDALNGRVEMTKAGTSIVLDVGGNVALLSGTPVLLDVPVLLAEDRVLVPLRFVSQAMGATVDWDSRSRVVSVWCNP